MNKTRIFPHVVASLSPLSLSVYQLLVSYQINYLPFCLKFLKMFV